MNFSKKPVKLEFEELSYLINGCAFKVHKELGGGLLEKAYQNALAVEFTKAKLNFIEQHQIAINYFGSKISSMVPDFVVNDKIVVELKRRPRILPADYDQARNYLKLMNKKLALLVHFGKEYVTIKRVVNL
jgi:GxxExxY protein